MALPPGFLEDLRARTPLPALVSRRVRLVRSGRNHKGCCPFHGEKTPSFHVYADHFHCFGCGAHGDAISFVMQSQGASFPEAVAQLAAEAGLEVPTASPAQADADRRRLDLGGVLASASACFERWLGEKQGERARVYLRERGLSEATIRKFGLGWSGEGRGALAAALADQGATPAMLVETGLMRAGEAGRPEGDLFFNRVTFPIRDRRGRVISFGGRTLGDGQPKYINGPETAVFAKRRTLFGLDLAREAVRRDESVVVVEGYMDVIALHEAGFGGAVAPLGTALTEEQLAELWRLAPIPVLCFDGDAAGARAAFRAVELALPLLGPERSLGVVSLPAGEDPDTLVRRQGAAAFRALIERPRPLSETLFDMVREATGDASAEQRAQLRVRLDAAAARIADRTLASEYRTALRDRYFATRPGRGKKVVAGRGGRALRRMPDDADAAETRRRILFGVLLNHPELLHDVEDALLRLSLPNPLRRLRDGIVAYAELDARDDSRESLLGHLTKIGLAAEAEAALASVGGVTFAAPTAMPAEAEAGWWQYFGLLNRPQLEAELVAARRGFSGDNAGQARIIAIRRAMMRLNDDEAESDIEA